MTCLGGVSFSQEGPPVRLEIEPEEGIMTRAQGVPVRFIITAVRPVKLCLEKDPLTQFQLQISRQGHGPLPVEPLVVRDTRELFYQKIRVVELKPGQHYPYRANLRRLTFTNGEQWKPGDYTISATFNLCDQATAGNADSSGKEVPIKAKALGRFMVAN